MPRSNAFGARFSREILSAEFDLGVRTIQPHIPMLIDRVPMGDKEGTEQKHIITGNVGDPVEMFANTPPLFETIGDYSFLIAPKEYGRGLQATENELADARIPVIPDAARRLGEKAGIFTEQTLVTDVIESSTAFDGFDGEPLFSTTHNWDTSDLDPGVPAPTFTTDQDNVVTGSVSATTYANTTQVLTDLYAAMARMEGFKDDKGTSITPPGNDQWVALVPATVPTSRRFFDLAFVENTRPGDNTNRDGFRFGINVVYSPYLTVGSEPGTWYLFKIGAGHRPPLVLQERQGVDMRAIHNEEERIWKWFFTMRFGVGYSAWWNCIKIDNS